MGNDSTLVGRKGLSALSRPFFAYGVFKKGQVGYYYIEDYIVEEIPAKIPYVLKQRNGMPIAFEDSEHWLDGYIYKFDISNGWNKGTEPFEVYTKIGNTRKKSLYQWESAVTEDNQKVNVLVGKDPNTAEHYYDGESYDGRNDLGFSELDIEYIKHRIDRPKGSFPYTPNENLFEHQMTYMLIWSLIDKFLALVYGGQRQGDHVKLFAQTPYFKRALQEYVPEYTSDVVHHTQSKQSFMLNPNNSKTSMDYYYKLRCNVTHGGKNNPKNINQLVRASTQLINIMDDVLNNIFNKRYDDLKKPDEEY